MGQHGATKSARDLLEVYAEKREEIRETLRRFKRVLKSSEKKIFAELCFCLCTPQSKAEVCDRAIRRLQARGLLLSGSAEQVKRCLVGVRFANVKARRIVWARRLLARNGGPGLKRLLDSGKSARELRLWLIENVEGLGPKEASHFLRNVGLGEELAILDRHVLAELRACGVIGAVPKSLSLKRYLELEGEVRRFSRRLRIPVGELDLLLWSRRTGKIFK